ncbi:hypothetical protein LZ318_34955 [Saccharopolyspora indica]|uniref:sunset domain-containing protein n=1 Tax=Saccharopolyspora indica TaxID=1229659 RepID=UPI0022EAB191|nr:hypothetical protein [Saccharopolyspora indica]MDA3649789.1 hypothetical protein [Saccharopolyspora indica]
MITWLFTQVWLWSLAAFALGALITWLLFVRPLQRRLAEAAEYPDYDYDRPADYDEPDTAREPLELLRPTRPRDPEEPPIGDWDRPPRAWADPRLQPDEDTENTWFRKWDEEKPEDRSGTEQTAVQPRIPAEASAPADPEDDTWAGSPGPTGGTDTSVGSADPSDGADTWRGSADRKDGADTWVGSADPKGSADTWRGSADPKDGADTWRGSAGPEEDADTWRGAAGPEEDADTWRGAAGPEDDADTWRGAAGPEDDADTWRASAGPKDGADTWVGSVDPNDGADTWRGSAGPNDDADTWRGSADPKDGADTRIGPSDSKDTAEPDTAVTPVSREEPQPAASFSGQLEDAERLSGQLRSLFESEQKSDAQPATPYVPPVGAEATQVMPAVVEDEDVPPLPQRTPGAGPHPGRDSGWSGPMVKGHSASRQYHTPESPQYDDIVADVWFRSAKDAEIAGFTSWNGRA